MRTPPRCSRSDHPFAVEVRTEPRSEISQAQGRAGLRHRRAENELKTTRSLPIMLGQAQSKSQLWRGIQSWPRILSPRLGHTKSPRGCREPTVLLSSDQCWAKSVQNAPAFLNRGWMKRKCRSSKLDVQPAGRPQRARLRWTLYEGVVRSRRSAPADAEQLLRRLP